MVSLKTKLSYKKLSFLAESKDILRVVTLGKMLSRACSCPTSRLKMVHAFSAQTCSQHQLIVRAAARANCTRNWLFILRDQDNPETPEVGPVL